MSVSKLDYGIEAVIEGASLEAVIARVKDALKQEGFGVLSEIDVAKTLKEKIGVDVASKVILGACNPRFAYEALEAEPNLALLLPCNVVVSVTSDQRFSVSAVDARAMLAVVGNPALDAVALEVNERFERVLAAVAAP